MALATKSRTRDKRKTMANVANEALVGSCSGSAWLEASQRKFGL
jgi:hypothetical protein